MGALTPEEEKFIEYWEHNRLKKRKITKQLSIGLPIGVLLVAGIFASVFAGWDKHAEVQMQGRNAIHRQSHSYSCLHYCCAAHRHIFCYFFCKA